MVSTSDTEEATSQEEQVKEASEPMDKESIKNEAESNDGDDNDDESENENESQDDNDADSRIIRQHKTYEQVMLDVNRCAGRLEHIRQVYFHRTDDDEPPEDLTEELQLQRLANDNEDGDEQKQLLNLACKNTSQRDTNDQKNTSRISKSPVAEYLLNQRELKRKLAKLIVKLLIKKPDLHYYQGFHDVCLTYMTLYGDKEAYTKLDELIDSHFKTFMQPTMNETQDFLAMIPIIVGLHDNKVQEFLDQAEVGTIFALSWVITWFSHVIPNERDVERIFEFLGARDPHMVLYICAEIVLYTKDRLLNLEPEMSTVHHFLTQIPRKEKLPLDKILEGASNTFKKWPPELVRRKLDNYRRDKLQVHNYNILRSFANRFSPTIANLVATNGRTAIIVLVVASAIALQFDRWIR